MSSLLLSKKWYLILSNKPFKPFYNLCVPRPARKEMNFVYYEIPTQQKVANYWDNVIDKYQQEHIQPSQISLKKPDLVGKKIIWQYWGQGFDDLPKVVQLGFLSVDKFKQDFQVIRLTDDNIKEYLHFPDYVFEKRKNPAFRPVFFSDLLRLSLIKYYGGVWLDATVVLTEPLNQRYFDNDFFVFSRDYQSPYQYLAKNNEHCYFNWQDEFNVTILSSIMFGKPNNHLVAIVLDLMSYFWQTETSIPHYFFMQILFNRLKQRQIVTFDFPVIDDVLPHLMQEVMFQTIDEKNFFDILAKIGLHKLTLHHKAREKIGCRLTYYGFLKQLVENSLTL